MLQDLLPRSCIGHLHFEGFEGSFLHLLRVHRLRGQVVAGVSPKPGLLLTLGETHLSSLLIVDLNKIHLFHLNLLNNYILPSEF